MKEKMEKLIESWKTIDENIEVWESIDKEHFRTEEECKNHNDNFIDKYTMYQNFTVEEELNFFDPTVFDKKIYESNTTDYIEFITIRTQSFKK